MRHLSLVSIALILLSSSLASAQSMCGLKDQTNNEIKVSLLANKIAPSNDGTCVFLLSDPEKGKGNYRKAAVQSVSYQECLERGEEAVAVKWFPKETMSYEEIVKIIPASCPSQCSGFPATCPGICYCVGTTSCK